MKLVKRWAGRGDRPKKGAAPGGIGDRGKFIHDEGNRSSWSLREAETNGATGFRRALSLDTSSAEQAGMRGGGGSGFN